MTKAWTNRCYFWYFYSLIKLIYFCQASLLTVSTSEWPFHLCKNEIIKQKKELLFSHEVAMFDNTAWRRTAAIRAECCRDMRDFSYLLSLWSNQTKVEPFGIRQYWHNSTEVACLCAKCSCTQTRQRGCWCVGLSALCSLASLACLVGWCWTAALPKGLDPPAPYCTFHLSEQSMMGHGSVWTQKTTDKLSPVTPLFLSFVQKYPHNRTVGCSSGSYCIANTWSEQLTLLWLQKESIQAVTPSVSYVHTHKSCVTSGVKWPGCLIWELCFLLLGHPLALCVQARPFPLFCIFPVEKLMRNQSREDMRPMTAGTKGVFVRALHHGARGTTDGEFEVMMGWWTQQ